MSIFNRFKKLDGFIPSRLKKEDWLFFGIQEVINPTRKWINYKAQDELQKQIGLETMSCVNQGYCRGYAALMNFLISINKIDESNIDWLRENGYFDNNGKLNFSDRAIAKLSGTTRNGNSAQKVAQTIRDYGLIPENRWTFTSDMDLWEEYYAPIPDELLTLGYEFKKRFETQYLAVSRNNFEQALYESPVIVFVDGYYQVVNGIYQDTGNMSNHCVCLMSIDDLNNINDSYNPFDKRFVKDYPFYSSQNMFGIKSSNGYQLKIVENIINNNIMEVIKQKNDPEYYAVDVEAGTINAFGGWESYVKFLQAKWCSPVIEVDSKFNYLKDKYHKDFVKGDRIGVII